MKKPINSLLRTAVATAEAAGKVILKVYRRNFRTQFKTDASPLTAADMSAHRVILKRLQKIRPLLPVLSEESVAAVYPRRRKWKSFWLVDPLDGTREFVRKNGEFTVNIALIRGHEPVIGVVHAPVFGVTYYAAKGSGAYKKNSRTVKKIHARRGPSYPLRVFGSRPDRGIEKILKDLGPFRTVKIGSSLKMGYIAEGRADVYPRTVPSMEWDTAAGDCIIREAGGRITDLRGRILRYNKRNLKNPRFIASVQGVTVLK